MKKIKREHSFKIKYFVVMKDGTPLGRGGNLSFYDTIKVWWCETLGIIEETK